VQCWFHRIILGPHDCYFREPEKRIEAGVRKDCATSTDEYSEGVIRVFHEVFTCRFSLPYIIYCSFLLVLLKLLHRAELYFLNPVVYETVFVSYFGTSNTIFIVSKYKDNNFLRRGLKYCGHSAVFALCILIFANGARSK
jgi:hypothetical protein